MKIINKMFNKLKGVKQKENKFILNSAVKTKSGIYIIMQNEVKSL